MPAGRPTAYRVAFCEIAHAMSAQGATIREIAEAIEINEASVYRWTHEHEEFRKSIQLGKEAACDRVEQALYRRATGYSFDAVKIMQAEGRVIVEPYVEHVPPDVSAAKYWLQNRRGTDWQEKQAIEHSGKVTIVADSLDEQV